MKENIINIKNSMSDNEIIEILIDSVKNYENHKSKQLLGKYLHEMSQIISEYDYLKDTYIYHYSGMKLVKYITMNIKFYLFPETVLELIVFIV